MTIRSQRCTAHTTRGKPCQRFALTGSRVCIMHGAAAGQVREAARRRIEEMVWPALGALRKLIDEADSDSVRITAIRDVLDRAGLGKTIDKLQVDNQVVIEVRYEDRGMVSAPEPAERTRTLAIGRSDANGR